MSGMLYSTIASRSSPNPNAQARLPSFPLASRMLCSVIPQPSTSSQSPSKKISSSKEGLVNGKYASTHRHSTSPNRCFASPSRLSLSSFTAKSSPVCARHHFLPVHATFISWYDVSCTCTFWTTILAGEGRCMHVYLRLRHVVSYRTPEAQNQQQVLVSHTDRLAVVTRPQREPRSRQTQRAAHPTCQTPQSPLGRTPGSPPSDGTLGSGCGLLSLCGTHPL